MKDKIAKIIEIAVRERTWRLEETECGGDEIMESVDKLRAEITALLRGE